MILNGETKSTSFGSVGGGELPERTYSYPFLFLQTGKQANSDSSVYNDFPTSPSWVIKQVYVFFIKKNKFGTFAGSVS